MAATVWQAALAQTPAAEHFELRVRPVLAQRCYACHGPDKQFSGLRVDSRAALLEGGKRGAAIAAGAPEASLLLRAVRHEAGLTPMPSGAGKLSAAEIGALEEWVRQGAPWPASSTQSAASPGGLPAWYDRAAKTHWSFQPVKPATPPPGAAPHPVDRFLRAALTARGLQPARPADRLTLIRRASFVLTGLPPTPEEIATFTQDRAPGAFDRAVDRLIASPHFGEHWARHWMDVVRYGETRGYEWNYEIVGAWRYRDYLIRAFNADVPYNQFVREHIAGDLLEAPRLNPASGLNESVIATAFFRLGEAGHDDCIKFREISLDVVDNQIDTLGKAFQGLTLSCARCHDHKLDPIPTADYYGLFGVLNSSRAQTHTIDAPVAVPPQLAARKLAVRADLARAWAVQLSPLPLDGVRKAAFDDPLFPLLAMRPTNPAAFAATWQDLAARYREEAAARAQFNRERFTPYLDWSAWMQDGLGLRGGAGVARAGDLAVATEGEQALTAILPAGLHTNLYTDRWNGALRSPLLPKTHKYLSVRLMGGRLAARRTVLDNCAIGEGYRVLENGSPRWHRLDTYSAEKLPAFAEIVTKRDNPRIPDRPGMIKASETEIAAPRSYFGATQAVLHDSPESPREELGHLMRLFEGAAPESLADLTGRYRAVLRDAVTAWEAGRATDDDVRWLDAALRAGLLDNRAGAAVNAYRELEARLPEPRTIDGMGDAGAGFDTPILRAGNPHAPGAVTPRHFLSRIGGHAPALNSSGSGRRELAEAIADPANPLTARLMVNRVWGHVFGRGLTPTVDNLGREGERPSHPELLDYLATRFVAEGWSVKKLARLLATSAAFQQASDGPAPEGDPANALLHHYPARRLAAESIRDAILATSGALNRTLHGPSIAPPRNEPQDYRRLFAGPLDGHGRRSVYTQITRMEGSRFLEIFDYPNPMATRGARDITNVPAQALAMMNDPFVHEQARVWAGRIAQNSAAPPEARVDAMFRTALGRPATAAERARFAGLAAELASLHRAPVDSAAVWKDVAHALFNLKEFLYLR
ncbi:MAG: PSD1 domain-containing protein [Bryobacterales bacterium]|nr:PSD1 domain-containing protein [Bryobacterales bacterium]